MNQIFMIMRLKNRYTPLEDKAFDERIAKAFYHIGQSVTIKAVWYYPLFRNHRELICR